MSFDAVVIGAGPAGYVCAIRLAQLGKKTAIVEGRELGGVCLNVGCIPSKALISAAKLVKQIKGAAKMGIHVEGLRVDLSELITWKDGIVKQLTTGVEHLLTKNGVTIYRGMARVLSAGKVELQSDSGVLLLETNNVVVATGSRPIEIPGFVFDHENVWSSTDALKPTAIPGRILVIGGGYIGLELGFVYKNLGSEVRVVEFLDRVLPGMDPEISKEMAKSLKKKKIPVHLGAKAKSFAKTKAGLKVSVEVAGGKTEEFLCDVILSSVGRLPNAKGLGLEECGVKITEQGFVEVNTRRESSVPGIFAVGDVAGQPMLAHKGTAEALVVAAVISGDRGAAFDPVAVPLVIFTDPEVASVGLSCDEAKEQGFATKVGKFPFRASGRALSMGEVDGWTKIVVDAANDKVLGVHMVGPGVTELIAEATLALEMGATAQDIAMTIHAHPTLPETLMEAAENVHKMAVHILN